MGSLELMVREKTNMLLTTLGLVGGASEAVGAKSNEGTAVPSSPALSAADNRRGPVINTTSFAVAETTRIPR